MSTYFATLTTIGAAKIANAQALGEFVQISHMSVGDGNGAATVPNPAQTTLVNEVRRAALNTLTVDPLNAAQIIAEQVILENVGGWWIRELGLIDADGDLVAVANCPDTYKPLLAEGSGRTQVIRMVLVVSSTAAVQLKIDPAVVLATRQYVDTTVADELSKRDFKDSCRVATTGNLAALSGLINIDGVVIAAGNRVLVKDQAIATQNGIYVGAEGAWARAVDADSGAKLTASAVVPVEDGAVNGDTLWMVATDGTITVGTTALTFHLVGAPAATQAEAEAATSLSRMMTPLRVAQAIRALPVTVPDATTPTTRYALALDGGVLIATEQ